MTWVEKIVFLGSIYLVQDVHSWSSPASTKTSLNSRLTKGRELGSALPAFQSFRYSSDDYSSSEDQENVNGVRRPTTATTSNSDDPPQNDNNTDFELLSSILPSSSESSSPLPVESGSNGFVKQNTKRNGADQSSSNSNNKEASSTSIWYNEENAVLPVTIPEGAATGVLGVRAEDVIVVPQEPATEEDKTSVLSVSDLFQQSQFVDMFRGSANYIANHRSTLVVYHIPGDWIDHEDPKVFRDLMNDISLTWLLGLKIVIVVGCRYQVEKRMGKRMRHLGMVVTDQDSLRIVKEEAGYVQFEIQRQLARSLQTGRKGVDGNVVSGNFYSAQPFGILDGVDYEYSGFVRRFDTEKIRQYHQNKDIVLLTTLGVSPTGEVFNVNSEYLAAHAGGALGANKVIYFAEKNVELRHRQHGSRIPHLRVNDGTNLLKANDIKTHRKGFVFVGDDCPYVDAEQSMLVKIGWSMEALSKGVKRVHIISPENGALLQEMYTRDGAGTMISGDVYDGIHQAKVTDVHNIYELIHPLVEQGTLVDRPKAVLETNIEQYHVYTRDDLIVACGQLKMYENGFAEIGCMVVNPIYRARGRGDAMLGYLERLCLQNGATVAFVLSTQAMEWFVERGFDEVSVDMLPPSRQKTYNKDRASKIYMKKISSVRELDASELFWDV